MTRRSTKMHKEKILEQQDAQTLNSHKLQG